jgi:hypothetical protein
MLLAAELHALRHLKLAEMSQQPMLRQPGSCSSVIMHAAANVLLQGAEAKSFQRVHFCSSTSSSSQDVQHGRQH